MSTLLAVYGTAYGQTERIIRRIAAHLEQQGIAVTAYCGNALPHDLDLDAYDAVLVGASIIVGKHQKYVADFVRQHVVELNAKPSVFVSVCGAAGSTLPAKQDEARGYLETFLHKTGWRPALTASFGGALAYTKYSFFMRWIIKRIARQAGAPTDTSRDHDLTDWAAVDGFANRVAATILHTVAA